MTGFDSKKAAAQDKMTAAPDGFYTIKAAAQDKLAHLTFEQRCRISEQCLPEAPYRAMLTKLHDEMLAALVQPEQEPVGNFAKFTDGIWREVTDGSAGVPLYTHPPQRQPLTDKEIQRIWDVASGAIPGWSRHIAYARAIEAAHGIGDKTT